VDPDDGPDEDGPLHPLLPPDDRLWRHPSEVAASRPGSRSARGSAAATRNLRMWPVALVAGLMGALMASGIGLAVGEFSPRAVMRPVTNQVVPDAMSAAVSNEPDWPAILDSVAPSVVTVISEGPAGESITSGVMWGTGQTSFALTDAASLAEATSVRVETAAGGVTIPARIVGADFQTGVAVLALRGGPQPAAFMGSVSDLQAGEPIEIVSSGQAVSDVGGGAVSSGVVSGTDRSLQASDGPTMLDMLTVAASGPAVSGSAVVDADGAVVGITTSLTPADGSAAGTIYAMPIDVAQKVADELIDGQKLSHPWLGITEAGDLPTAAAEQMGVSGGAVVDGLSSVGPAAAAGIQAGDVVTTVGRTPITSAASLVLATESSRVGHRVPVVYVHSGHRHRASLLVTSQPQEVSP
jgi:S1-C subfamily serine protease